MQIIQKIKNSNCRAFLSRIMVVFVCLIAFSANPVNASEINADNIINLVNKARKEANIEVLVKNELLQKAAEKKAQDMFDDNYFAHISPDEKTPWFWIENEGYVYRFAGENLAINYKNAEDEQKAWMDSELHRKNILNPEYVEIGVAVKRGKMDGQQTVISVQMFGAKFPAAVTDVSVTSLRSLQENIAPVAVATLRENDKAQKFKNEIDFKIFYQDNRLAINAWLAALGIVLTIIIAEAIVVFYKKHTHFSTLHDVENRQI